MSKTYDFSGWATRNNLRCSDGRVILRDAFRDNDGTTVPLVWNHQHNDPNNVLGHALLENRDEGVYAYCKFNDTESGKNAKLIVEHGDVAALSIYANKLKQQGSNVLHGAIREVSLVLAGANPGAFIDTVFSHSDDLDDEDAIIYSGEPLEFTHADGPKSEKKEKSMYDEDETVGDVFNTLTDKQKAVVYAMIGEALQSNASKNEKEEDEKEEDEKEVKHSDNEEGETNDMANKTVQDVLDSMNEEQKAVLHALIGEALRDGASYADENEEDDSVKHNAFDDEYYDDDENVLSHSDMEAIFAEARRPGGNGSLKDAFLAHGIENIDYLFPDDRNVTDTPLFIKREDGWVKKVMDGVHHTPFSRIRSLFADITPDEARARGYMKGNAKKDEVFSLLRRATTPTTVYKKQKIDRDDQVDIADFDVVAWMKREMRMMLDEELARAFLIGDGRLSSSEDKINEQNIRPIWKDADLFTVKYPIAVAANATEESKAKALIEGAIRSRKLYKGSGNPTFFTTEDNLTSMLLIKDLNQRLIYDSVEKLATILRVKEIVTVTPMEGMRRYDANNNELTLAGIYVNLNDYNVGADKGGSVNMFDDFDIDFNAMKYLIETRCSGALTVPYSAVALEFFVGDGLTLVVEGAPETDEWLGKTVGDMQSNVHVNDDYITGTLYYTEGFTGFSSKASEQQGYYLTLKFTAEAGATTVVEIVGGKTGPVTLDSDMVFIARLTDIDKQTIKVTTSKDGSSVTKIYGLQRLNLENE